MRISCQSSSGEEKPGRSAGRTELMDDIDESVCTASMNVNREETALQEAEPLRTGKKQRIFRVSQRNVEFCPKFGTSRDYATRYFGGWSQDLDRKVFSHVQAQVGGMDRTKGVDMSADLLVEISRSTPQRHIHRHQITYEDADHASH